MRGARVSQLRWVFEAVVAVLGVRGRAARLLFWLVVAALAVAGTVLGLLVAFHEQLVELLLRHVLREHWVAVGKAVVEQLLAPHLFDLAANATLVLSLGLMSLFLFALREKVSVAYEVDRGLCAAPPAEVPLWTDVAEVLKSTALVTCLQIFVFAIGWSRDPGRLAFARWASYAVLFLATALDFIPPLLARHGLRGSTVLLALARRPIASILFGACFSAPGLVIAQLAPRSVGPVQRLCVVVGASALVTAWATVGGTRLAARMLGDGRGMPRMRGWLRACGWLALLGALAWQVYVIGALLVSIERKTQILKCHYRVSPSSISVDLPRLGALLHKNLATTLRFEVEIENPTTHDVELEDSRIVVENGGERVGELTLPRVAVAAHASALARVDAPVELSLAQAKRLATGPRDLRVTLLIQVTGALEVPIFVK